MIRQTQDSTPAGEAIAAIVHHKVTRRLAWIIALAMLIAMMDRINLSFAALTMSADIGLTPAMLGVGTALFFVAYLVAEIPSNLMMVRFGARLWIARIMISWGLVSACMALVREPYGFYALRFLLGVAEAGFLPGVFLYLTLWIPEARRGRMNSYTLMAIPVAGVVTALLSAAILRMDGTLGLAGWQWIFLLEAAPAVLLGIFILFYLHDRPDDADWLTSAEKTWLNATLAAERVRSGAPQHMSVWAVIRGMLRRPAVVGLVLGYFGLCLALSSLLWTPQILQSFALAPDEVSLIAALPSATSLLVMWLWARRSDLSGERHGNYLGAALLACGGFLLVALSPEVLYRSTLGLTLAASGSYAAMVLFWTLPASLLATAERPVGIAFISLMGVIAGMLSPVAVGYLRELTGDYSAALYLGAIGVCISGIIIRAIAGVPAQVSEPSAQATLRADSMRVD